MAKHNKTGSLGEDIAVRFIENKGLDVKERNYWKPYGEIDIIARENNKTIFVEVKTVSCEINQSNVTQETHIQPEDNMHPQKIKKLRRIIEAYLLDHKDIHVWRFDLLCVFLDQKNKKSRIKWIKDIIL